jgi:hypothetical protein
MVRDDTGQLYTIEGLAAALIMIITAFLVVNATSVYTAGDTHINDMQLEALGSDALKMMDVAANRSDAETPLQDIIRTDNSTRFKTMFLNYSNVSGSGPRHDIQFVANYTCRDKTTNNVTSYPLSYSRNLTGGEHTVRATKWVIVDPTGFICSRSDVQAVLVEVLLWRD